MRTLFIERCDTDGSLPTVFKVLYFCRGCTTSHTALKWLLHVALFFKSSRKLNPTDRCLFVVSILASWLWAFDWLGKYSVDDDPIYFGSLERLNAGEWADQK